MKKKTVKVLAVLMCIMTAVAFMPTFAFAAEAEEPATEPVAEQTEETTEANVQQSEPDKEEPPEIKVQEIADTEEASEAADDATVYFTLFLGGSLADVDGEALFERPVTVSDNNRDGRLTYDEAAVALHEEYDKEENFVIQSTGWVTKFWGKEGATFSFLKNGKMIDTFTNAATVKKGDMLTVAELLDTDYYMDALAKFNTGEVSVREGEEFKLKMTYDVTYDDKGKYSGTVTSDDEGSVFFGLWNGGRFEELSSEIGDDGYVTLEIDTKGTFFVTAQGVVSDMEFPVGLAPVCVVTVYEDDEATVEAQYQYVVAKKKEECMLYLGDIDINAYRAAQQLSVITEIIKGIATINGAETFTAVEGAFGNVKAAIGKIKTNKQMTAEENAVKAVGISSFSVKAGKKRATVKWAKKSTFSGYQIYYKQAKKGAKYTTTTATSKTIKSLKKKKKYTFKVRGYKKMNGKTIYGKWSSSKTIKIK